MTGTSRVTFLRPRLGYRDWLRAYRLFIDDAPHGKIKRGQEVSVDITPGPHEVEARIDWTGSPRLAFTASPGADILIRVEPGGNAFQALWQARTRTGYIKLTLLPPQG